MQKMRGREQTSNRAAKIGFCLLAALSMCLGGNKWATVSKLPTRRQSPTVFDFEALMHAVMILLFWGPWILSLPYKIFFYVQAWSQLYAYIQTILLEEMVRLSETDQFIYLEQQLTITLVLAIHQKHLFRWKGKHPFFLHSVISLTECIGIVRVGKYRVVCLSVCVCVCLSVCWR